MANRLATNKGNVAHHLGVLLRAGLVRRDRTRTVRGGTEQYYVRAASRMRFDNAPDALTAMMSDLTEHLAADPGALLEQRVLRLTPVQAAALSEHLATVLSRLQPAGEREARYGVAVAVYRHGRR